VYESRPPMFGPGTTEGRDGRPFLRAFPGLTARPITRSAVMLRRPIADWNWFAIVGVVFYVLTLATVAILVFTVLRVKQPLWPRDGFFGKDNVYDGPVPG
jgi:hypothetical protein